MNTKQLQLRNVQVACETDFPLHLATVLKFVKGTWVPP